MTTAPVTPATPFPAIARSASPEAWRWRESVASGTLTVFAIVAPLLAALAAFVRSTHRGWQDLLPLATVALLLPCLRLWKNLCVRRRAMAGILTLFVAAFLLIARFGFAAGLSVLVVVTCVLGLIVGGRVAGFLMIGVAAVAYVAIGVLVSRHTLLLAPEVDPLKLRNWLRLAASTSLQSALLAVVVDFVIRHVEANARSTTAALEQLRAAYASVRENEERYRAVVDHALDGVLLTSPSGETFEANPAMCRMLGRTAEEICALGRAGVVDPEDPRVPPLIEAAAPHRKGPRRDQHDSQRRQSGAGRDGLGGVYRSTWPAPNQHVHSRSAEPEASRAGPSRARGARGPCWGPRTMTAR